MEQDISNYRLDNSTIVFADTIKNTLPYISKMPRNHESIFFVTKGSLSYKRDGIITIINKGQVGYIARGSVDISSAYRCEQVSYIAINFLFDKETPLPKKTLPFQNLCSKGIAYDYEKLFYSLLNAFLSNTVGHMLVCNGILLQIIGNLYNEYKTTDRQHAKFQKIEKAMEYLKYNYHSPEFKINTLAKICHMSEKNFRRIFFDVYKKNPYAFLQEYRINKALILLTNTNKAVSDIALECGFSDVYSFSHCFKKHTGISPTKYKSEF